MIPRLIFGIFLFIGCYQLAAQETTANQVENDYRQFREVFEQEFKDQDSPIQVNRITVHPASLAGWLSNIPDSDENTIYAIGISDPGMAPEEAVQLAILRAKIISALLLQAKISSITDSYSNDEAGTNSNRFATKYINYYLILASFSASPEQFQIINQFYTSFNEAVVLVKYDLSAPASKIIDSVMLKIDIYQAERQQKNKFEFEEKCEIYGLSKQNNSREGIEIFYYFYRSVNHYAEIVSRYNGEEVDFPQSIFRYQTLSDADLPTGVNEASYKLSNGLWKAFLQSLLQNYTLSVINPDVEIAQVGDNYPSSSQNLSRESVVASPAFRIKGLRVFNNELSVVLKRIELTH